MYACARAFTQTRFYSDDGIRLGRQQQQGPAYVWIVTWGLKWSTTHVCKKEKQQPILTLVFVSSLFVSCVRVTRTKTNTQTHSSYEFRISVSSPSDSNPTSSASPSRQHTRTHTNTHSRAQSLVLIEQPPTRRRTRAHFAAIPGSRGPPRGDRHRTTVGLSPKIVFSSINLAGSVCHANAAPA